VCTAIKHSIGFNTVADDLATTMLASGGERMNGTLETVKKMNLVAHYDLQRFIVIVSANFALIHTSSLCGNVAPLKDNSTIPSKWR